MLPAPRKRPRSGIQRAPEREWSRHRKFVKKHDCVATLSPRAKGECEGRIEFAHVASAAHAGKGIKTFDWYAVSLCEAHHRLQHGKGAETFMQRYGIDLWKVAAEFVAKSPDIEMKQAMDDWCHQHRTEHVGRI